MNSAHSFTEGMDYDLTPLYYKKSINPLLMDLEAKRLELIRQKDTHERVKKTAHEEILKINRDLRKLAALTRHAEEMFNEKTA